MSKEQEETGKSFTLKYRYDSRLDRLLQELKDSNKRTKLIKDLD